MGDGSADLSRGSVALPDPAARDYGEWPDARLRACYRRNSELLRAYGVDARTVAVLCAVEEHLRARDIDPDEVIADLYQ